MRTSPNHRTATAFLPLFFSDFPSARRCSGQPICYSEIMIRIKKSTNHRDPDTRLLSVIRATPNPSSSRSRANKRRSNPTAWLRFVRSRSASRQGPTMRQNAHFQPGASPSVGSFFQTGIRRCSAGDGFVLQKGAAGPTARPRDASKCLRPAPAPPPAVASFFRITRSPPPYGHTMRQAQRRIRGPAPMLYRSPACVLSRSPWPASRSGNCPA